MNGAEMASSSNQLDVSPDLKYIQASSVDISNFVSVKLSNTSHYPMWKSQMLTLISSQELLHIIDAEYPYSVISQYEKLVKSWILSSMIEDVFHYFVHFTSARELWMELESIFNPPISDTEGIVLFRLDPEREKTRRRLRNAARDGCWWKAKSILKMHEKAATKAINANGNTILHIAVEMGHNYFVEKLLEFLKDGEDIETQNYKGRTALHTAAMVDNKYAAQLLVQKRKELLAILDYNQKSPWKIASDCFKSHIAAYLLKSTLSFDLSSDLDGYPMNILQALNDAIYTKQYDLADTLLKKYPGIIRDNYIILFAFVLTFPAHLGFTESFIYPSFHNVRQKTIVSGSLLFHSNFLDKCVEDILRVVNICNNTYCSWLGKNSMILLVLVATLYPMYQFICLLILVLRLPFSMLYFLVWKVFAVTVRPIKNIEKKKKEYEDAKKTLGLICDQMGRSNDGYRLPILLAVCKGTYEVVDQILITSPDSADYVDDEGHNLIQLAIINRAEKVYNLLYHLIDRHESGREMTDSSMNNLAHLVGRLAPSFVLERTTGAALQLQRELIWREEVEKLVFPLLLIQNNMDQETPAMVFTREHRDLMNQGEIWMKTTAESCSIAAALIVTVVFAAAITVPGGNNQDGIPMFKKETAFTIFAIANAFSLFTSATSLLLFLSILTARFSEKDFLVSLPRRLILGLLTLFLSTTAMIVAFGAILFLVFCDQRPWMLAPICGFACLPISVIATIKVPLLVDLIQSTYFPIFGKQTYLDTCKFNRRNTVFKN